MNETMNNQYAIASLYEGGWRSTDKDEIMSDFEVSEEEAQEICDQLRELEEAE